MSDTQEVERIRTKLAKRDTLREQGNGYPPFGQQTHEQMEATMSRHYELIETVFLDAEVRTLLRIIDRQQGVIQAAGEVDAHITHIAEDKRGNRIVHISVSTERVVESYWEGQPEYEQFALLRDILALHDALAALEGAQDGET
jgi:hypothetical protein